MLYFNLNPIFKARRIDKPYTFLVKAGIAPHTATKIITNKMHVMRLNHIEIICRALYCEPNDLLAFKQDPNHFIPENHPLVKLTPTNDNLDWQEQLKTMPLDKLKQISKILDQTDNQE
jgi:DNA-binding Xre family transcriptional regulator